MLLHIFTHKLIKILCLQASATKQIQRRHCSLSFTILTISLLSMPGSAFAQTTEDLPSSYELKKMSMEELMNLEVTSVSKRPEKLTEVASAIQVITQEEIRYSGASSIPEVLRLASNLQVAQANSSQWAISARGFNNVLANKLLVMIDGRTVYTPLYAGVFWDVQNILLEDIERIEVISGPGGTLWGANAVNGVINIITKSSHKTQGFYAEAAIGTELRGLGSLRYGGKLGDGLSYRVYGTAFKRGSTLLKDGSDANDEWTMGQGGVRLDWDATKNTQLTLQSDFYNGRPNPDGSTSIVAKGGNVLGRWTHTTSAGSDLQLQVYYDQTWRDFRNGFAEDLKTYDLSWQNRFQAGQRHEVVWGLDFRLMDHEVENLALFAFLPEHKSLHLYSAFVQDEITLIKEHLHLTLGAKLEHNSYTGFEYQPNGRLAWTLTEHQTLWAAISRAVRTPARIDRDFYLFAAPEVPIITGDGFISTELLAYELGWRLQPQEKLSISLASFYHVYDNIRSAEPGPPPQNIPITFENGVSGETYGIELSAIHQLADWWRLQTGYTFLRKDLSVKPNSSDLNGGSAESNDPQHQFLLQSMLDLPGRIELGTVIRYIGQLPDPLVPGYVGLDMRLGWKLNKVLALNIVGQNLTDRRHPEFVPTSPSPRMIERSIYGKIICRF